MFTADVRLVSLPVTVKDARGAPLGDLDRKDFEILEEGDRRDLAVFERRTDRPLSVALMLDASLSTAIELRYERESAARFLARLLGPGAHAEDRAAILSFSADVDLLQGFTRDQKALERALGMVRPRTGTSVYDALQLASGALSRREGRRVIVAITDGGDTTSRLRFADALRAAHDAEVAIYPLIVLPIQSDAGRNRGGEHALITLADKTGGETFVQHGTTDLDASFGAILRALRTQYLLGFYPRREGLQAREVFRSVEIRVKREGAAVYARDGYYLAPGVAPPPARSGRRAAETSVRRLPQRGSAGQGESGTKEVETKPPRRPPDGEPRPPIVKPGR